MRRIRPLVAAGLVGCGSRLRAPHSVIARAACGRPPQVQSTNPETLVNRIAWCWMPAVATPSIGLAIDMIAIFNPEYRREQPADAVAAVGFDMPRHLALRDEPRAWLRQR